MKILEVIPSLSSGGAERLVTDLSIEISKYNHIEVLSLYNCEEEYYTKKIKERNIKVHTLDKKGGFDLKCLIKLIEFIKNNDFDIIHCHLDALKYVGIAAIINRTKVFYTIHNIAEKDVMGKIKYFYNILFKYTDVTPIAICNKVKESAIKYYGNYMKKIPIVFNGINYEEVDSALLNEEYNDKNIIKFLCVATFKEQKNHIYLIDLFEKICNIRQDVKLYLVGDGPLKSKVEQYVIEKKLEKKVEFLGNRTDTYSLMKTLDIFILTSKYEGFSIAILEAMAAEMKVVVSNVGGNSEQIINNKTGVLFNLDNPNVIINSISEIIENNKIQYNAKNLVINKFNITKSANDYLKIFINSIDKG